MEKKAEAPPKKPYVKPTLSYIPLRPGEAVLGFCKTSTGAGPIRAGCGIPGGACRTAGS